MGEEWVQEFGTNITSPGKVRTIREAWRQQLGKLGLKSPVMERSDF